MNVLFLTFANRRDLPLPNLQEEEEHIYKLLAPLALQQHFLLHREPFASIAKIAEYLVLYRNHISIFHYSGHAGRDNLLLETESARAEGIAALLALCPKLKLVFLNGCSTEGQVQRLLEAGVPVVIATSAPIEDGRAQRFAVRFYQALANDATIAEAFNLATAEIQTMEGGGKIAFHRGVKLPGSGPDQAVWGLFHRPGSEDVLEHELPSTPQQVVPVDYHPNQQLLDTMWETLEDYSDGVALLAEKERSGRLVTLARKRMAILNSLPAPVAEHLRKLMVPVEDENEGFDKVSEARLRQMVYCYQIIAELLAFTLLAQLWETYFEKEGKLDLSGQEPNLHEILDFLQLRPEDNETYDYVGLIRAIREILDHNAKAYFVEELRDLRQMLYKDGPFQRGCFFMEVLRIKLNRETVSPGELSELCARAENSLADLLKEMGFLAKYTLAAIQDIDVLKFRHLTQASFKHKVVYLRDLLGGLDIDFFELQRFTDNRSVLLMDEENKNFLNLTPFIIDANAFEEDTDVSKIFFLSHYESASDTYVYLYVNRPDNADDWIRIGQGKFNIVKIQLDAFKALLRPATEGDAPAYA